uniref:Uncharacterized protein n=1 Tax=Moniliophthora roreri TaxID=221103 RepID=A0A0W0G6G1_MONRR
MDRIDSGATEDSAFDSVLNTPADEDVVPPFEKLGERLLNARNDFCEKTFTSISTLDLYDSKSCEAVSPLATIGHGDNQMELSSSTSSNPPALSTSPSAENGQDMLSAEFELPSFATPRIEPSNSAMSSSPELESQSFCRHQRASSLYTLPNEPICVSASTVSPSISSLLDTSSQDRLNSTFLNMPTLTLSQSQTESLQDSEEVAEILNQKTEDQPLLPAPSSEQVQSIKLQDTLLFMIKFLCFLPWCIAAGCALVVFPKHIEAVVFSPGFYRDSSEPPPKGIRRFAHLAEFTIPHVGIFISSLAFVAWWSTPVGLALAVLMFSQGIVAWQDFRKDESVPLGEDDRMSVYWILKEYVAGDGCFSEMCKTDEGFFVKGCNEVECNRAEEED